MHDDHVSTLDFDSLMAMQVHNAFQCNAGLNLFLSLLLPGRTIDEVARQALEDIRELEPRSAALPDNPGNCPTSAKEARALLGSMDQLSDDELEPLLEYFVTKPK